MSFLCALLLTKQLSAAVIPIDNFNEVSPGLFRGGRPSLSQITDLNRQGIKTNINLQGGDLKNEDVAGLVKWLEPGESAQNIAAEKKASENLGMEFFNFPLNSLGPIEPSEDLMIDQALALMADKTKRPLFLHCQHGKDRTGLLVALYRVRFEGWSVNQAHEEWVELGHNSLNAWFTGQLDSYFYQKAASFEKLKAI